MKKLFTCFWVMLTSVMATAQVDATFQFVDANGNEVKDGSVIVVNTINEDGQMVVPLSLKNVSGTMSAGALYENIDVMPNGSWQTCLFGNCLTPTATGYSAKNIAQADDVQSIETEWIPAPGGYATWEATLQVHVFNVEERTIFNVTTQVAGDQVIGYGPKVTIRFEYKDPNESASQYLCGLYTNDDIDPDGYGVGYYVSGKVKTATDFSSDITGKFEGFKVVGMRVGLAEPVSDLSLYIGKVSGTMVTNFKSKFYGNGTKGWNTIMLDEADQFELTSGKLRVGYEYNQKQGQTNDCYPVGSNSNSQKMAPFYFYANLEGKGAKWYQFDDDALAIQLIVEGELPGQHLVIDAFLADNYVKIGDNAMMQLKLTNLGMEEITEIGYVFSIDNNKINNGSKTVNIPTAQSADVNIAELIPSLVTQGKHSLTINITSVNGAKPTGAIDNNNCEATTTAYTNSVARQKHLVEHFTSWTCTYCYLGYALLRAMTSSHDDVAWVALHGNQSSQKDPYYFSDIDKLSSLLGMDAFPVASFDRLFLPEMKEENVSYSIGYYEQYSAQMAEAIYAAMEEYAAPSFVKLDVRSAFNSETREMQVAVSGTGVEGASQLLSGCGLTIYITEQGLTGRQYSSCSWTSGYSHDNTLRAVLTTYNGDAIAWDGDNFTIIKTYTVPANYKEENLSITAFVAPRSNSNIRTMSVNNCERVALNLSPTLSVISTESMSDCQVPQQYYSLDGRQTSNIHKGFNIVRMSDGRSVKVVK